MKLIKSIYGSLEKAKRVVVCALINARERREWSQEKFYNIIKVPDSQDDGTIIPPSVYETNPGKINHATILQAAGALDMTIDTDLFDGVTVHILLYYKTGTDKWSFVMTARAVAEKRCAICSALLAEMEEIEKKVLQA